MPQWGGVMKLEYESVVTTQSWKNVCFVVEMGILKRVIGRNEYSEMLIACGL